MVFKYLPYSGKKQESVKEQDTTTTPLSIITGNFFLSYLSKTFDLDANSSGELLLKSRASVNTPEGKGPRAEG